MRRAEGVARARNDLEARDAGREGAQERLALVQGHGLVGAAVQEERRRREAPASRGDLEGGRVALDVLQPAEAEAVHLLRAQVRDLDVALTAPERLDLGREAPERRAARPADERAVVRAARGVDQRHGAAQAVSEERAATRVDLGHGARVEPGAHARDVVDLARGRVLEERLRLGELERSRTVSRAGEVEAHDREAARREPPRELGPEAPVHEALEAVQDEHEGQAPRRPARQRDPPANRAQRIGPALEHELALAQPHECLARHGPKRLSCPSGRTRARRRGKASRSSTGPSTALPPSSARISSALATALPEKWLFVIT